MHWQTQLGIKTDARENRLGRSGQASGDPGTTEPVEGSGGRSSNGRGLSGPTDGSLPRQMDIREVDGVRDSDQELDGGDSNQDPEIQAGAGPEQIRQSGPPEVEALRVRISGDTFALGFTLAELQLIVMAAAYEIFDSPAASDSTFDMLAKYTETPNIPDFAEDTGQWVHKVMTKELADLTEAMIEKVAGVPHDKTCHHSYIWEYFQRVNDAH